VSTDACTPALRRAILRNGLVNKRGKPDSWMPVDLFVEYLNLELKLIAEMEHLASMSSSMTVSLFAIMYLR
jgi:hypothetical protein